MAVKNDVVASVTVNDVGAAHVGNDVIARAAEEVVITKTAFDTVVAPVAINGIVVRTARNENVVALGAAQHDGLDAGVMQIVGIGPDGIGIIANHQWCDLDTVYGDAAGGVGAQVLNVVSGPRNAVGTWKEYSGMRVELVCLVDLQDETRRLEDIRR